MRIGVNPCSVLEKENCTKIPEVVILTCSLKLCAQWFKPLLRILPFVSVSASWNLQSMQYYGILQVSRYKETPAAKVHGSHDPHSVCTESDEWLAASYRASTNAFSTKCMLWEWTWSFTSWGSMRYDLSFSYLLAEVQYLMHVKMVPMEIKLRT